MNKQAAFREYGSFDINKLIDLTKNQKVEYFPIGELNHNLKKKLWSDKDKENTEHSFSPNEVMNKPSISKLHYKNIKDANLEYPILIYKDGKEWDILDGLHRLAKANMLFHKVIAARVLTPKVLSKAKL